jgi:hypothetical protein
LPRRGILAAGARLLRVVSRLALASASLPFCKPTTALFSASIWRLAASIFC